MLEREACWCAGKFKLHGLEWPAQLPTLLVATRHLVSCQDVQAIDTIGSKKKHILHKLRTYSNYHDLKNTTTVEVVIANVMDVALSNVC